MALCESGFDVSGIHLDYSALFSNVHKIFDKFDQTLTNYKFWTAIMKDYAARTKDFNKISNKVKNINKTKPYAIDVEVQPQYVQNFIKALAASNVHHASELTEFLKRAEKAANSLEKQNKKMKADYQKRMKRVISDRENLKKIEAQTKAQFSKTHITSQDKQAKEMKLATKLDKTQQKKTVKIQNEEQKLDQQIRKYLEKLQEMDKERLQLIFKTSNQFSKTLKATCKSFQDQLPQLDEFVNGNTIQRFLDDFVEKHRSTVISYQITSYNNQNNFDGSERIQADALAVAAQNQIVQQTTAPELIVSPPPDVVPQKIDAPQELGGPSTAQDVQHLNKTTGSELNQTIEQPQQGIVDVPAEESYKAPNNPADAIPAQQSVPPEIGNETQPHQNNGPDQEEPIVVENPQGNGQEAQAEQLAEAQ